MALMNFLYILNIGFIAIIFLIHLRFIRKDIAANRYLSLLLFSLGYTTLMLLLLSSKWILGAPHFGKTGSFFLYLIYPSAYLYTYKIIKQEKWKLSDVIHFVPAVLYLIDYFPYFLKSGEEKRAQLLADYATNNLYIIRNRAWFLPGYFHFAARTLLAMAYVVLMAKVWAENFYGESNAEFRKENRSLMQWTFVLILLLAIAMSPSLVTYLFNIPLDLASLLTSSIYFITICFSLFLFFRPEIIYGLKGIWVAQPQAVVAAQEQQPEKEVNKGDAGTLEKVYIRESKVERIKEQLEEYFSGSKAYLYSEFTIADLSRDIGYPVHQISAFLNSHLGMNFNEFINSYRINHLLDEYSKNPEWKRFRLEALGQKVGFNNRYTFLNAFKKVTGETPSSYFKTRNKS